MKTIAFKPELAKTEGYVTCQIVMGLEKLGIPYALEYRVDAPNYDEKVQDRRFSKKFLKRYTKRSCQFDIVVVYGHSIIGIIECKRKARRTKGGMSPQMKRYSQYGLPVFLADGQERITPAIEWSQKVFEEYSAYMGKLRATHKE